MPSVGARTAGVVLSFAGESMRSPSDEGGAGAERPGLRWRPQRQARRASRVGSTSYQRRSPSQTRRSRQRRSDRPAPATTRLNSAPGPCSTAIPDQDFHARRPITKARGGPRIPSRPSRRRPRDALMDSGAELPVRLAAPAVPKLTAARNIVGATAPVGEIPGHQLSQVGPAGADGPPGSALPQRLCLRPGGVIPRDGYSHCRSIVACL